MSGCEAVGEEPRVASFGAHARDECGGIAAFGQRDGDPIAFLEWKCLLASDCRVSLRDYTAVITPPRRLDVRGRETSANPFFNS